MLKQWKKLDSELQDHKTLMAACLRCLIGKPMRYQKGNMRADCPCVVVDVGYEGDSVRIRTKSGKIRWVHPNDLIDPMA